MFSISLKLLKLIKNHNDNWKLYAGHTAYSNEDFYFRRQGIIQQVRSLRSAGHLSLKANVQIITGQ